MSVYQSIHHLQSINSINVINVQTKCRIVIFVENLVLFPQLGVSRSKR